ncbi:MAG: hypothetical protein ABJZ69_15355 [Hyphomicrobiales bacterium]
MYNYDDRLRPIEADAEIRVVDEHDGADATDKVDEVNVCIYILTYLVVDTHDEVDAVGESESAGEVAAGDETDEFAAGPAVGAVVVAHARNNSSHEAGAMCSGFAVALQ